MFVIEREFGLRLKLRAEDEDVLGVSLTKSYTSDTAYNGGFIDPGGFKSSKVPAIRLSTLDYHLNFRGDARDPSTCGNLAITP
jgi:hypothetical protein